MISVRSTLLTFACFAASAHTAVQDVPRWVLDAGAKEGFVVGANGWMYAWGKNPHGTVGNGTTTPLYPPAVSVTHGFTAISAGETHVIGLTARGDLYAWGLGADGRLGTGNTNNALSPELVQGTEWASVSVGFSHSAAIKANGILYTWGANDRGQLGLNHTASMLSPTEVYLGGTLNNGWKAVSCGLGFTVGLKVDGTLWAWGMNDDGQVGDGTRTQRLVPKQIGTDRDWKSISAGFSNTLALKANGNLYAWGRNGNGQVADGTQNARLSPYNIASLNGKIASMNSGKDHCLALTYNGIVFSWGLNTSGQLGYPVSGVPRKTPFEAPTPYTRFTAVSAGHTFSMGVTTDGVIWTWGSADEQVLGRTFAPGSSHMVGQALISEKMGLGSMITGQKHSGILRASGSLGTTGLGTSGQLGDGHFTSRTSFIQVDPPNMPEVKFIRASAGTIHTLAIQGDGILYGTGHNGEGQLGINSTTTKPLLTYVDGTRKWIDVSAGDGHSLGLSVDGSLWAWGRNYAGQLGDNSTVQRLAPVKINVPASSPAIVRTWAAISAGADHSAGILTDGSLWTWGTNADTRLGLGAGGTRIVPTQVKMASGENNRWVAVKCGRTHTVALMANGKLWAWGGNENRQVGNNSSIAQSTPVQIGVGRSWTQISTHESAKHTLAIAADGTVWGWGRNTEYQLGDGTRTMRPEPVGIYIDGARSVHAGGNHSFIILESYCYGMGLNLEGYLGLGNTQAATTPAYIDWMY